MGALNSFKLGMQLSDAADTRRRQAAQDAWVNEERGQKRAEWQRAEAERTALDRAGSEILTSLDAPSTNPAATFLEGYGLRPQGQAVPVGGDGVGPQQFIAPQYNTQSPEFDAVRRIGGLGVKSRQELLELDRAARAARLQQEVSLVNQQALTAPPEVLSNFLKNFTDFKGVTGEASIDPKTNLTTLKVGSKQLELNRVETAQYLSGLYKLHKGDQSGLADMAAIDKDLAASAASDFARMAEVTKINNGAMEANNRIRNDNIRTGNDTARLGRERMGPVVQMIDPKTNEPVYAETKLVGGKPMMVPVDMGGLKLPTEKPAAMRDVIDFAKSLVENNTPDPDAPNKPLTLDRALPIAKAHLEKGGYKSAADRLVEAYLASKGATNGSGEPAKAPTTGARPPSRQIGVLVPPRSAADMRPKAPMSEAEILQLLANGK